MADNLESKQIMATNIERFMLESAITRKYLSKIMNVPYTTVCDWINGNTYPRIDKIEKMAQIFGVTKSDLIEESNRGEAKGFINYANQSFGGDYMLFLGVRIRKKRNELKLSQEELASMLGYTSRTTIAKIESGSVDLSHSKVSAFAKALNTTPAYLVGWENFDGSLDGDLHVPHQAVHIYEDKHVLNSDDAQSNMLEFDTNLNVTYDEAAYIKKYRALDRHGREIINIILEKEHSRARSH